MKKHKPVTLLFLLLIVLLALFITSCDLISQLLKANDTIFYASKYINYSPGKAVKYQVTDDFGLTTTDIWIVAQEVPDVFLSSYDYIVTVTRTSSSGDNFNSTLGGSIQEINNNDTYTFFSGMNSSDQVHFFRNVPIPVSTNYGSQLDSYFGKYKVTEAGNIMIKDAIFDNCVRIDLEQNLHDNDYLNGSGYVILAPDIGIVKIVFTRCDSGESYANTTVIYEYLEHTEFPAYRISGKITTDGTTHVSDMYVQIASRILDSTSKSDATGIFTLDNIHGPDIRLFVGYDGNDEYDEILDFGYPSSSYPKRYELNNIYNNIDNLHINLSNDNL